MNHIKTQKIDIETSIKKLRKLNVPDWYSTAAAEKLNHWNEKRSKIEADAKDAQAKRASIADAFLAGELDNPLVQAKRASDEILLIAVDILRLARERAGFDPLIHSELRAEQERVRIKLEAAKAKLTEGLAKLGITSEVAVASATLQDSEILKLTASSSNLYRAVSQRSGSISQPELDMTKDLEAKIRNEIG